MQCAYHMFAPGTDFTALLVPSQTVCVEFRITPMSSAAAERDLQGRVR